MKKLLICIYITCIASVLATSHAQADCSEILAHGISDKYGFTDNSTFSESVHNSLCTEKRNDSINNESLGIGIPIDDVGNILGIDMSTHSGRKAYENYCKSADRNINQRKAIEWFSSKVNPVVVEAWKTCNQPGGFKCIAKSISDNTFTVNISWNRRDAGKDNLSAKLISAPIITNATCQTGGITKGLSIEDKQSISTACNFIYPAKPAVFIINSSMGSATCLAYPQIHKQSQAELLNSCQNKNAEACLKLINKFSKIKAICDAIQNESYNHITSARQSILAKIDCGNLATLTGEMNNYTSNIIRGCKSDNSNVFLGNKNGCSSSIDNFITTYKQSETLLRKIESY